MKKLVLAAVLSTLAVQPVSAGGLSDPIVEPVLAPETIAAESKSGKGGYVIQLALLAVLAMIIENN